MKLYRYSMIFDFHPVFRIILWTYNIYIYTLKLISGHLTVQISKLCLSLWFELYSFKNINSLQSSFHARKFYWSIQYKYMFTKVKWTAQRTAVTQWMYLRQVMFRKIYLVGGILLTFWCHSIICDYVVSLIHPNSSFRWQSYYLSVFMFFRLIKSGTGDIAAKSISCIPKMATYCACIVWPAKTVHHKIVQSCF